MTDPETPVVELATTVVLTVGPVVDPVDAEVGILVRSKDPQKYRTCSSNPISVLIGAMQVEVENRLTSLHCAQAESLQDNSTTALFSHL